MVILRFLLVGLVLLVFSGCGTITGGGHSQSFVSVGTVLYVEVEPQLVIEVPAVTSLYVVSEGFAEAQYCWLVERSSLGTGLIVEASSAGCVEVPGFEPFRFALVFPSLRSAGSAAARTDAPPVDPTDPGDPAVGAEDGSEPLADPTHSP